MGIPLAEMLDDLLYESTIKYILTGDNSMRFFPFLCTLIAATVGLQASENVHQTPGHEHQSVHAESQKRAAIDFLSQLEIDGDERVLDVGTGDGKVSAYLSVKVSDGSVLGVDLCEDCAESAKETYKNHSFPNLSFGTADVRNLPFEQEFDIITSFSTLHLIEDKASALRSIKRSLRSEGRAIIQCPVRHGLLTALNTVSKDEKWAAYLSDFETGWHFIEVGTFEKLLNEVDLKPRHFKVARLNEVFETEEAFKASISEWLPHLAVIPQDKHEEFLEDLIQVYSEEEPYDLDGRIHFYVDRLEVEALNPMLEPRFQNIASEDESSDGEGSTQ